jgi:hypothetical protein
MNFTENIQVNKIEMKPKILLPGLNVFGSLLINGFPQRNLESIRLTSPKGYDGDRLTNCQNYLQIVAGKSKLGLCCINESWSLPVIFDGAHGIWFLQNIRLWEDIFSDAAKKNIATYRSLDPTNTHIWALKSDGGFRRFSGNFGGLFSGICSDIGGGKAFVDISQLFPKHTQLAAANDDEPEREESCCIVRDPMPEAFPLFILASFVGSILVTLAICRLTGR